MARTRVRRRRLTLSMLVLGLTAFLMGPLSHAFVAGAQVRHAPHRVYVVRPGDTLWGIAQRQLTPGADPRPLVDEIEQENGIAGQSLVPGRQLVIPVPA